MGKIKTYYKDIEIIYFDDKWQVECDYGKYENIVFSKITEWIDRKAKEKFKRYSIITKTLATGIVTSETENGEVWVSYDIKTAWRNREKLNKKSVTIKTNEKLKIVEEIKRIEEMKKQYRNEKDAEIKQLKNKLFPDAEKDDPWD